jgi:hypothetical protein
MSAFYILLLARVSGFHFLLPAEWFLFLIHLFLLSELFKTRFLRDISYVCVYSYYLEVQILYISMFFHMVRGGK